MLSHEIRQKFLDFFAEKDHRILPSASLVPLADPSILLINAGMAPLKRYFEGKDAPPAPRLASCQKCIRTVDIEKVGFTNRHNTFFEMLGNFSLGDYFKEGAIIYAWEFLTTPKAWLALDPAFLHISVHKNDDVAPLAWEKEVGVKPGRIIPRGDEHNLWTAGDIGPCGYDTEIFFDLERDPNLILKDAKHFDELEESGRLLEIWNLVFMEFNRDEQGKLTPLPKKNIDTGMGLERACVVLQGKKSAFETDLFDYLIKYYGDLVKKGQAHIEEKLTGVRKEPGTDTSVWAGGTGESLFYVSPKILGYNPFYLLSDHTRAVVFLLADGVTPSNLDRGYVLRRLIRRIIKTTYLLGVRKPYLTEPAELVISRMGEHYPELVTNKNGVLTWLAKEEENFLGVLERGFEELNRKLTRESVVEQPAEKVISGKFLFTLHDTYGFPFEVAKEFAKLSGFDVNEAEFEAEMEKQRQRARAAAEFATNFGTVVAVTENNANSSVEGGVTFLGYDTLCAEASFVGISRFAGRIDAERREKDTIPEVPTGKPLYLLYTNRTPFYADAGGQPGDTGVITREAVTFIVLDSKNRGEHLGFFDEGSPEMLKEGDTVILQVDETRRRAIMRAHTMAHASLKALREVLGDHISQAGSQLYPDRVRFDFSHFQAMTDEEMRRVEEIVNRIILGDHPVWSQEMPLIEAKRQGVTAVFEEKYGEIVRVINIGEDGKQVSRELCGGTHLSRTSQAGSFVLIREESVQSGIRRIEAATGGVAIRFHQDFRWTTQDLLRGFNIRLDELIPTIDNLRQRLDTMHGELMNLKRGALFNEIAERVASPEQINDIHLVIGEVSEATRDDLKTVIDRAERELTKSGKRPYCILLASRGVDKLAFSLKVSEELPSRNLKASALIHEVAKVCGGGGGGKDLFAEAGAKDVSKLPEAIKALKENLAGC